MYDFDMRGHLFITDYFVFELLDIPASINVTPYHSALKFSEIQDASGGCSIIAANKHERR